MYQVVRKILFWFPPEVVHHFSMSSLGFADKIPGVSRLLRPGVCLDPQLKKEVFGLEFTNPVGLGAGFDKNALYLDELATLGFGFAEIGTVTPLPQQGNEKPRLFRIPEHKAIINRMGFNNDGVKVVAGRLRHWRIGSKRRQLIIGGNIGKNKATPNENAWKDYVLCFRELFDSVDYFVINVSSPNTPGLRELQEKESLHKILSHLQTINKNKATPKPLLLKIAPDLSNFQLDEVIDLCMEIGLDGIVATNTTISRDGLFSLPEETIKEIGAGGLSGKPLMQRSTEVVRHIHDKTGGKMPVIASGGIFGYADVKEKLAAGASLVQVWTGFIYEGPGIVRHICQDLIKNN
ncbi:MAG TPA: quinone-dependent dihydroorotate dehydrogenase [Flavitalea sp.]|nr:quinone-dependent dihydroorotate dehydrogenase [Flavitalea sp.]